MDGVERRREAAGVEREGGEHREGEEDPPRPHHIRVMAGRSDYSKISDRVLKFSDFKNCNPKFTENNRPEIPNCQQYCVCRSTVPRPVELTARVQPCGDA